MGSCARPSIGASRSRRSSRATRSGCSCGSSSCLSRPPSRHRRTPPERKRSSSWPLRTAKGMVGRFTAKRAAPTEFVPVEEPSPTLEGMSWTVFPEPAAEPAHQTANANLLLTDKLRDAKVRLHRRLIEEINLQALERMPEDQIRAHLQQLDAQYNLLERTARYHTD